ncbi:MAG: LysM peptidoglycan-binding domain-containing protein [Actinobacteria bacterium]|nr:LysM peptidoglycan-binding domain-containing protein [Actinomycetota bacterium]
MSAVRRPLVSAIVIASASFGAVACGSDPNASSTTLRPLTSTNYATTPPSVVVTVDPANTLPPPLTYTVLAGDSMYAIASRFGVKAEDIASYNAWADGILHPLSPGQVILIPPGAANVTTTLPGMPIPVDTTAPGPQPGQGKYVVEAGDSLSRIADKWGVEVSALLAANGWVDSSVVILPGDEINIPARTKNPQP